MINNQAGYVRSKKTHVFFFSWMSDGQKLSWAYEDVKFYGPAIGKP